MKHIKLFENKFLDDILDKLSSDGMDSLTELEKEYLNKYDTSDENKIEREIERNREETNKQEQKIKRYQDMGKYDPREDKEGHEFYNNVAKSFGLDDMTFDKWSDEEIDMTRISIFWDEMDDEDIKEFLYDYKIIGDMVTTPWDKLPDNVKQMFGEYLSRKGFID